jgi:hypothetical protein
MPNGGRYPLVGGTRERRFAGTSFELHKLPQNAATPQSGARGVGRIWVAQDSRAEKNTTASFLLT